MNYQALEKKLQSEIEKLDQDIEAIKSDIRHLDEEQFLHLHSGTYSERQLYRFINQLPINIYWYDLDSKFLGANARMARIFGCADPKDIIGRSILDFSPADMGQGIIDRNEAVLEQDAFFDGLEDGFDAAYRRAIYHSKKIGMRDSNGELYGVAGISIDITQRIEHEEELRRAKEKLEYIHRAQADFVRNMSYDIRTPCTGIIGVVKKLSEDEQDEKRKVQLGYIEESAEKLLQFFNDIFDVLTLEQGDYFHDEGVLFPKQMLYDIVNLYKPKLEEKQLHHNIIIADTVPDQIILKKQNLYRVLMNLVSNAIKFTETGAISIQLSANTQQQRIVLTVSDTGIGIDASDQDKIFDRFIRLSSAYEGQYEGSGIGLYVTKQLIDDLNGHITVQSNPEGGTRFTCDIPYEQYQPGSEHE